MTTIVYYYGTVSFRVDSVKESYDELENIFKDADGFCCLGDVYQVSWCIQRDVEDGAVEVMPRYTAMTCLENEVGMYNILDNVPKCLILEDTDMWDED